MSPKCVLQKDAWDCGPAALATVAAHWGIHARLPRIRADAATDQGGSNLLGLMRASRRLGFHASCVRATWQELVAQANLPAIAHVRLPNATGHFVVVSEIRSDRVLLLDPAVGPRWETCDGFRRQWEVSDPSAAGDAAEGGLMLMLPSEDARSETRPPTKRERLWRLLRPEMRLLIEALTASLGAALMLVGSSVFLRTLIDRVFVFEDRSLFLLATLGMLAVTGFRAVFGILREYFVAHLARRIGLRLNDQLIGTLLRMPATFFRRRRTGDLLARIGDAERIKEFLKSTTIGICFDLFVFASVSVAVVFEQPSLGLLVLATLPLFGLLCLIQARVVRSSQERAFASSALLEANLAESLAGVTTIRLHGAEGAVLSRLRGLFAEVATQEYRAGLTGVVCGTANSTLFGATTIALLWFGGRRVLAGEMTIGELMFFYSMVGYLFGPVQNLAQSFLAGQDADLALERMGELLGHPQEEDQGRYRGSPGPRRIQFEGVDFSYEPGRPVLEGIDLTIPAGATVAIVGESGSGKTTLASLLLRQEAPTHGRILLDDVSLREWDLEALRSSIGIVTQEVFLFDGTVLDNVALGDPEPDLQRAIEACRLAQAHEFIERMSNGYRTPIGEHGALLSGGERQRLAIARALYRRPGILVLDEATSNLDFSAERALQDALAGTRERTVLLIAHRLTSVVDADHIVVLARGRVVETGTHAELLARKGAYAALWQRQTRETRSESPLRHVSGARS